MNRQSMSDADDAPLGVEAERGEEPPPSEPVEHAMLDLEALREVDEQSAGPDAESSMDLDDAVMLANLQANLVGRPVARPQVGRFVLHKWLGAGNYGRVYEASDPELRRKVALKLFDDTVGAPAGRARVKKEAQALAQVVHPNVVAIYDVGEHEGRLFLTMELVGGETLEQVHTRAREEGWPWRRLLALYVGAGKGLSAVHAGGLVHGDFKPANVIVDESGQPRVLDFGLARGPLVEPDDDDRRTLDDARVAAEQEEGGIERGFPGIATGGPQGTPAYMAPEQFEGKRATARSDQYAFCVALFEAVYQRPPFLGSNRAALWHARSADELQVPERAARRGTPPRLLELLRRGMRASEDARHESMGALVHELEALVSPPRRTRRWWMLGSAVFVVGAGTLGLVHWYDERRCEAEAVGLRERWNETRSGLADDEATRGLRPVIDVEIERLASAWESTCHVEPRAVAQRCREQSRERFEQLARLMEDYGLPPSGRTGLLDELSLCLEERPTAGVCREPSPTSEARTQVRRGQALLSLARVDEAIEAATAAIALAKREGTVLVEIEAQLVLGEAWVQAGQEGRARDALDQAIASAVACEADVLTVDAALGQVEVEIRGSDGRAERTTLPLGLAEQILDKPTMERLVLRQARRFEKRADVELYLQASCEPSTREALERALALRQGLVEQRRERGEPAAEAGVQQAQAELNLVNFDLECGQLDPDEAVARLEAARARLLEDGGVDRGPRQAAFEYSLGLALTRANRLEEAEQRYLEALSIFARFAGDRSAMAAKVHHALSSVLLARDELVRAQQHAEANLAILEAGPGQGSPLELAEAYDALGVLEQARDDGSFDAARSWHHRAVEVLEAGALGREPNGRERDALALFLAHEAIDACGQSRPKEAVSTFGRAREVPGQRTPSVQAQLDELAAVLGANGCG